MIGLRKLQADRRGEAQSHQRHAHDQRAFEGPSMRGVAWVHGMLPQKSAAILTVHNAALQEGLRRARGAPPSYER